MRILDPRKMVKSSIAAPGALPRLRPWLLALAIAAITWFAFQPSFEGQWLHWDDDKNFVENQFWRGLSGPNLQWMLTTFHQGPYQPLSWISLGLEYEAFGMDPRGYHITNVVLQALAAVAFFAFARALFGRVRALESARAWTLDLSAALAALLFAVHPLRVESVAWVTERRDVLSGLFFALTCWAYVHFATKTGAPRRRALVAALVCYTLSLASKGLGMTLPLGFLVLDTLVLGRWNGSIRTESEAGRRPLVGLAREKLGFFALAAVAAALAWKGQNDYAAMRDFQSYGMGSRLVQSCYGLCFYAWKTFWPFDLIPLVPLTKTASPTEARFAIAILGVALAAVVLFLLRRRAPALLATGVVYAIFLAPVLGLTQSGPQLVADRYSYLACMPIALLLGGGAARACIARTALAPLLPVGTAAVAFALAFLARDQSRVWRDDISLWTKTVAVRPDDAPAFRNLSYSYLRLAEEETDPGRARLYFERAIHECERGLAAGPDAGLLSNVSSAYRSLAWSDEARRQELLEIALDYARRAVERSAQEPTPTKVAYLNLGFTALDLERPAEAVAPFAWCADHYPDDPESPLRLAQTLKLAGRPKDALLAFARAVELAPGSPRVWMEKGDAHLELGEKAQAIACFERGIKLAEALPPGSAEDPTVVESWRVLLARQKKP